MDALLQVQYDWNDKLNSEAYFATTAVAMLRNLVILQEAAAKLPDIQGKGGKSGLGVIIHMPEILGIDPNISTPQSIAVCTADFVETPETNFLPDTGSMITCEQVVRQARAILQPLVLRGNTFFHDHEARVIVPIPDIRNLYPGRAGYRLELKVRLNEPYVPKCQTPLATWTGDTLSLAPSPGGGGIYITTDGTFPGPFNSQGTAILINDETNLTFASGTVVCFAAYAGGFVGSDVGQTTAP